MRLYYLTSVITISLAFTIFAHNLCISPSITFDTSYEYSLAYYHIYHAQSYDQGAHILNFYVTPFYQSLKHSHLKRQEYGSVYTLYIDMYKLLPRLWMTITSAAMAKQQRKDCCNRTHSGLDDIQIKAGYDIYFRKINHISLYGLIGIPTGERYNHIHAPEVGSRQVSIGVGSTLDYELWHSKKSILAFIVDVKYRHIFKTHRAYISSSFGKRQFIAQSGNVLDIWGALHYAWCTWNIEGGYNFWWQEQRKQSYEILKHKVYGAFSYNCSIHSWDTLIGCGASYELTNNQALERWAMWIKLGLDF